MGITLNPDVWHAKLYFWALRVWHGFVDRAEYQTSRYSKRTNLCYYIRVIVLWVPLVVLSYVAVLGGITYALFILPVKLFGLREFWTVVGVIALVVGIIVGIVFLASLFVRGVRRAVRFPLDYLEQRQEQKREAGKPSFASLIKEWIVAKKQKICPLINFGQPAGKEA